MIKTSSLPNQQQIHNKNNNKNKTIKYYIIMFELFIFFVGMIGCALLVGRICEEGDYND